MNPFRFPSLRAWLIGIALAGLASLASAQTTPSVDQLSDAQIQEFIQKAQASGLSEAQIEQAALMQGFSPSEVARMRDRIATKGGQKGLIKRDSGAVRRTPADISRRKLAADRERNRPDLEPDQLADSLNTDDLRPAIFGMSFFKNEKLSFEPNLRMATPTGYVLGPDDELVVDIFGNASQTYKLKVSPEGTVKIENLPPILVSGLPIEAAQTRIIGRLRQAYSGLNQPGGGVSAQVSLGAIRSIRVTITGEVEQPGSYTVPSLATAFNALYQAGGPSENGSFRSIELRRGNKVLRTIDLYDFLLKGDQKDNVLLRDGDVIRVPDYLARVEMAGEVRRPMLYEVKKGETLREALAFAGGFTDQAYTASFTLRRNTPRERRIANVADSATASLFPQSGDKIIVGKILNRYENRVQILGAVFRPGSYALGAGSSTVRELLRQADGLREDAFQSRAVIRREGANLESEVIPFDLGKVLRGEVPDIPLRRQDVVVISALKDLREEYLVNITGAVNIEGEYPYSDSMRVSDLVVLAGGFSEAATPTRIEVARRIKTDTTGVPADQSIRIYRFDLDSRLRLNPLDARFALRPFDVVYVRTDPRYEEQRQVVISGEVQYPGKYAIRERSERITNLIERAGGLRPEAFLRAARFSRNGELVATDLRGILDNPLGEDNLLLRDGDTLVIPKKTELVRIQGGVINPATVNFKSGFDLSDYISEAGGYTEQAIRKRVYVIYANGSVDRTRSFLFFKRYPRMETGATVIVPFRSRTTQSSLSPAERVGLFSLFGSLAVAIATVLSRR